MRSILLGVLMVFSTAAPSRPAVAQISGDTMVVLPGSSLVDPGRIVPHRATWRVTRLDPDGSRSAQGLWTETWARSTEGGRPAFFFGQLFVDTAGALQWRSETVFDAESLGAVHSTQHVPGGVRVSYRYAADTVSGTLRPSPDAEPRDFEVVFDEPAWEPLVPVPALVPLGRLEVGDVLRYPIWNQTGPGGDVSWNEARMDSVGTTVTADGRTIDAWYLTGTLAGPGTPVIRSRQTAEPPFHPWFVVERPALVREWTLVDWEPFGALQENTGADDLSPASEGAAAPASPRCDAPGHRQFDFWIGEWDVVNRQRNPATPEDTTLYETGSATNRVYPILGGCAVVEHWEGSLVYGRVLGFSVRAWDPTRDVWTLVLNWPQPGAAGFSTLEGEFEAGIGSFRRENANGRLIRYRFKDITEQRLTWEGSASDDGGESWSPFWVMDFRRRPPEARALFNGPSRTMARCPAERARSFDFLIGDWQGEEREVDADGTVVEARPISIRAWSILDGCAVMDLVTYGDDPRVPADRFRVRSFVEAEDGWVQYSLDRGDAAFARWQSAEDDDRLLAMVAAAGAAELERVRWLEIGSDTYRRQRFTSADGGVTWRLVAEAELTRR